MSLSTNQSSIFGHFGPILGGYYLQWKQQLLQTKVCRREDSKKPGSKRNHTAAIEGLESSPFSGWVTSAPNIMVGMSLTNGILQLRASTRTVFLPPICSVEQEIHKSVTFDRLKIFIQGWNDRILLEVHEINLFTIICSTVSQLCFDILRILIQEWNDKYSFKWHRKSSSEQNGKKYDIKDTFVGLSTCQ